MSELIPRCKPLTFFKNAWEVQFPKFVMQLRDARELFCLFVCLFVYMNHLLLKSLLCQCGIFCTDTVLIFSSVTLRKQAIIMIRDRGNALWH